MHGNTRSMLVSLQNAVVWFYMVLIGLNNLISLTMTWCWIKSPCYYCILIIFRYFQVLAVKKINFSAFPGYPSDLFIELVANISRLNHPNLAELVGYCAEHGQCLLVYEFYQNGSLCDLLNLVDDQSKPLSWSSRVKIALGSARALE